MISATVSGRLGRDAEVRAAGGTTVLSFTMASDRYDYQQKTKVTDWVRVSMFGERGAKLEQYLTKGAAVVVRGALTVREYTAKDGAPKHSIEVRADDIELLGSRGERREERQRDTQTSYGDISSDDIPF